MTSLMTIYLTGAYLTLLMGILGYFYAANNYTRRIAARLMLTFAIWPVWLLVLLWKLVVRGIPRLWRDARG